VTSGPREEAVEDSVDTRKSRGRAYRTDGRRSARRVRVGVGFGVLFGAFCIRHWKQILVVAVLWSAYLYSWKRMGLVSWFVATVAVLVVGFIVLRRQD
jgi:hypothetical protein